MWVYAMGAHSQCFSSRAIPRCWLTCSALLMLWGTPPRSSSFISQEHVNTSQRQRQLEKSDSSQRWVPSSDTQGDPETIKSWGWETRLPVSGLNSPPPLPPWPLKMRPNPTHTLPSHSPCDLSPWFLLILKVVLFHSLWLLFSVHWAFPQLKRKQRFKKTERRWKVRNSRVVSVETLPLLFHFAGKVQTSLSPMIVAALGDSGPDLTEELPGPT